MMMKWIGIDEQKYLVLRSEFSCKLLVQTSKSIIIIKNSYIPCQHEVRDNQLDEECVECYRYPKPSFSILKLL